MSEATQATAAELTTIARHFLIAAIWADAGDGTSPRVTRAALITASACAADFVEYIGPSLFRAALAEYEAAGLHPDCLGSPCAAFGHDLYLTLEGHCVGFWDRDALDVPMRPGGRLSIGEALTYACEVSAWANPLGSGRLEFYRGRVYFRRPT
jgi:hypothetical protein